MICNGRPSCVHRLICVSGMAWPPGPRRRRLVRSQRVGELVRAIYPAKRPRREAPTAPVQIWGLPHRPRGGPCRGPSRRPAIAAWSGDSGGGRGGSWLHRPHQWPAAVPGVRDESGRGRGRAASSAIQIQECGEKKHHHNRRRMATRPDMGRIRDGFCGGGSGARLVRACGERLETESAAGCFA